MNITRRPLWIGLALAVGATIAFTSNAVAGRSVRDAVYPNGADLAVTVQGGSATAGYDVAFSVTVSDHGSKAANGLTLKDTIPAGTSIVAVVPQQGACAEVLGTISCALGDLPSGGHAL